MERIWPEVNARINYPLKRILLAMEERRDMDMTDPITKFCVSFVTCNVAFAGLHKFVEAWNHHSIPGELQMCPVLPVTSHCYIPRVHEPWFWSYYMPLHDHKLRAILGLAKKVNRAAIVLVVHI